MSVSEGTTPPPSYDGQIAFLVYDSRSGSTLLSNEIAKSLPAVAVSPEFELNAMFKLSAESLRTMDAAELGSALAPLRNLVNLGVTNDVVASLANAARGNLTHDALLRMMIGHFLAGEERTDVDVFVIKKGTHLRIWEQITDLIPGAQFVHIFRDARAVVNSKLSTVRPHYPREVMAWGGPFLAGLRWRYYSQLMHRAAARVAVHDVKYEDLLDDPGAVVRRLASHLQTDFDPDSATSPYSIPESEQGIHRLVSGGMDTNRAQAWESEMSSRSIAIVEGLSRSEMLKRGYDVPAPESPPKTLLAIATSAVEGVARAAFHYPYNRWVDRSKT